MLCKPARKYFTMHHGNSLQAFFGASKYTRNTAQVALESKKCTSLWHTALRSSTLVEGSWVQTSLKYYSKTEKIVAGHRYGGLVKKGGKLALT